VTALWGRGFRPFFLLVGCYGCVAPLVWVAWLAGLAAAPAWLAPSVWHAHEMLFGVVAAAVAGFLSTSVPVWSGTRSVQGAPLAALVALWLLGRASVLGAGALPAGLVAACDLPFLPALAALLVRPLWHRSQRRNWGFVPILAALFACNAAVHAEALGLAAPGTAARALHVAVVLVTLLIVVIGGRITPAFTRNALLRAGEGAPVRSRPWLDRLAVAAAVAAAALEVAAPRTRWSGLGCLVAGLAVAGRMAGWRTFATRRDPLLWSLHLGYAWVAAGLLLVAAADLTGALAWTTGAHALTAGAMGGMLLAVMTRVGLGHTGRPLCAPKAALFAYLLVHAGAFLRTAGPWLWPGGAFPALALAGLAWAAAFGVFAVAYAPLLTRPRVDGLAG
jgi:uncharacterized protein involved in response to NO